MSLSWANKFAKNALLTAQKKIDLVLDIKEEDEEGNESGEPSLVESAFSDKTEVATSDTQFDVFDEVRLI